MIFDIGGAGAGKHVGGYFRRCGRHGTGGAQCDTGDVCTAGVKPGAILRKEEIGYEKDV